MLYSQRRDTKPAGGYGDDTRKREVGAKAQEAWLLSFGVTVVQQYRDG